MTETITLSREEYEAMQARIVDLEDILAARTAEQGARIPHDVAVRIMEGENPVRAWREHRGFSLRQLARTADVAPSYLSEIESGHKPGSVDALNRLAQALETTIDALVAA
jgi:mRNA interferase RelE/StbE